MVTVLALDTSLCWSVVEPDDDETWVPVVDNKFEVVDIELPVVDTEFPVVTTEIPEVITLPEVIDEVVREPEVIDPVVTGVNPLWSTIISSTGAKQL